MRQEFDPAKAGCVMRQEISIRSLRPCDEKILKRLLAWSRPEDELPAGRCEELLDRPDNIYWVALEGEEPVGWLGAHRLARFRGDVAFIYEVDVRPRNRRQGIATSLILHFKKWCGEAGIYGFFVLTNESNLAATRLYAKTGGVRRHRDEALFEFRA